jgi:hypothetical protein
LISIWGSFISIGTAEGIVGNERYFGGTTIGRVDEERVSSVERCQVVEVPVELFCRGFSIDSRSSGIVSTYQLPFFACGEDSPCSK